MNTAKKFEPHEHVTLNIAIFKKFNVWFYIEQPRGSYKYWLALLHRILLVIFVFMIPPLAQCMYVYKLVSSADSNVQEVATMVNLVVTESLTSFKILYQWSNGATFLELIRQLNDEFSCQSESHQKILRKSIKRAKYLTIFVMFGTYFDVLIHMIVKPAVNHFKSLPLKMDFIFFDAEDTAYFIYIYAYQILYKPTMITTFAALQSFNWACMSCATSQLDILINKLENMKKSIVTLKTERNCIHDEAFNVVFKDIVEHHSAIIRLSKTVQATLGGQLSIAIFLYAFILGVTGVQILSIESPRKNIADYTWLLAYLSMYIINLFIDCYFGDALTEKSVHLATLTYATPWTDLSMKLKKNVLLFVAKTQQPIVLVAAKITPVNIETFTKVMNWAYKGFAVVNQMKP